LNFTTAWAVPWPTCSNRPPLSSPYCHPSSRRIQGPTPHYSHPLLEPHAISYTITPHPALQLYPQALQAIISPNHTSCNQPHALNRTPYNPSSPSTPRNFHTQPHTLRYPAPQPQATYCTIHPLQKLPIPCSAPFPLNPCIYPLILCQSRSTPLSHTHFPHIHSLTSILSLKTPPLCILSLLPTPNPSSSSSQCLLSIPSPNQGPTLHQSRSLT
jgi:hypothetical protein